jgi:hypothetical protein
LAGTTDSFGAGGADFWLVKTDEYGNEEWNHTYGGTGDDWAYSLVEASDGGYALAGATNCSESLSMDFLLKPQDFAGDFWLVKTDSAGNMEWNQTYGGSWDEAACSLVEAPSGGYALAGFTRSPDGVPMYVWLVKTDSFGDMEWNVTYGETWGNSLGAARSLVVTSDGGFALACDDVFDWWLVKTDSSGTMEWNQAYGSEGHGYDLAYSLVTTGDGGYVIAGVWEYAEAINLEDPPYPKNDICLVKTDEFGNAEWNHTYGYAGLDGARSVFNTSDGGFALACYTNHDDSLDFWLIKTDENGVAPVVPEAAWVVLPLLATTTIAVLISKKKLFRSPEKH